jgi:hypothetical protein
MHRTRRITNVEQLAIECVATRRVVRHFCSKGAHRKSGNLDCAYARGSAHLTEPFPAFGGF